MNIIKLRDKIMTSKDNPEMAEFFNKNLKGKYAYWIKMRYIFPLDSLSYYKYIEYEQYDEIDFLNCGVLPHIDMYSEDECLYDFVNMYVDTCETERINGVQIYKNANKYSVDFDLDINQLRNFRSWLASELVSFSEKEDGSNINMYTPEQLHMLYYYKNDMYNDVVKYLSVFGHNSSVYNVINKSCGCCNNGINELYDININSCDALSIYKNNIHKLMVETFSNIEFWKMFNTEFIEVFKKYIDNILKAGMIIDTTKSEKTFECNCLYSDSSSTEKVLKDLSTSLNYIITDDISGHINYIQDSLYNWADKLYDLMSWNIK